MLAARLPVRAALGARCFSVQCGVLKEAVGEKRVSMVPSVAEKLVKQGYTVQVEKGAGTPASFPDSAYEAVGCKIVDRKAVAASDVTFSINPPPTSELAQFKDKILIGWVGRLLPDGKKIVEEAAKAGVTLVDTTAVPRITTAQKLDVLSSQAKCAGHRAVIEAVHNYQRFLQGEMTAAGKYPPTHTMVLGVGVAGLAAMGTANALGSVVRAWDVRDVSDQVKSMGGKWITVDFEESGEGQGGYAKESSAEFQAAQKATFHKHAKEVDLIVTTAAIPGRKSPVLLEDYMVKDMKPGSVIVDLAAAGGGNCTLTKAGETYVTDNGVTIVGALDLPGRMAAQASSMYAHNMLNLMTHVAGKEGAPAFLGNFHAALDAGEDGDIIVRSIVCSKSGQALEMPPPPQPTPVKKKEAPKAAVGPPPYDPAKDHMTKSVAVTAGSAAAVAVGAVSGDPAMMALLQTFGLSGAAGYQVVYGVSHALHTPLMSVTNAISGLTAVGGLLLLGQGGGAFAQLLAMLSVGVSSVNIVGGFLVSKRMLDLFRKPGEQDFGTYYLPPLGLAALAPWVAPAALPCANAAASLMCIGAIGGLASQRTAQFGCFLGGVGVTGAMSAALATVPGTSVPVAVALIGAGGAGGYSIGKSVQPMALPQTVAAFHSLVGGAAALTSIASFLIHPDAGAGHRLAAILGTSIGGITLTGSLIAFAKLDGRMSSAPMNLAGKNYLNAGMGLAQAAMVMQFMNCDYGAGCGLLTATTLLSSAMGVHLIGSVGGGDMPVCITVLNSYSGWALVAEGFLLDSPALTVVGSLIGFSGAILTKIMCDAMNRDIANVIFGGLNTAPPAQKGEQVVREHQETNIEATAALLAEAKNVMIVPGYGMAVSRAQNAISEIASTLRANDINVRFGIHPVAGRMPGQMNVLLAEAGTPYEWVEEMEEMNPDMPDQDVCLVVGANDITNELAQTDPDCSIAGMPVIEVWKAGTCIFMKRSMAGGYADLENPVFFKDNTRMLLGDAKATCDGIATKLKEHFAGQ
mmetsp:Transcript_41999/g.100996  ORF Transcript_41999/g.100996 Transcript_41999/m.100996 type:complete len:1025 (-) Transcript_41999:61-3135(-)